MDSVELETFLMENVGKYEKQYVIKSHEVDCNGFLRIVALMNFLQDIATEHADSFGLGLEVCRRHNLAWVGSDYLIRILRMPRLHETIKIVTWPSEEKLWGAMRDFVVTDGHNELIMQATSQWVLVDFVRRRPVVLKKYFPDYKCFEEHVLSTDFPQIDHVSDGHLTEFQVRFDDIDVNKHVNNAVYAVWAAEGLSYDFRNQYIPCEIQICFKKEALPGTKVVVSTAMHENESLHNISDKDTGVELARCRIQWRLFTS